MVMPAVIAASPVDNLRRFVSQLTVVDGDDAYDTETEAGALVQAAASGTWTLIWQVTVPPQRVYRVGSGNPQYPMNQGFFSFGATQNAANGWRDGLLRIIATNAAQTRREIVREVHTARLHNITRAAATSPMLAFPTDRQALMPFPEMLPDVVEDSEIQIWMRPDGAAGTSPCLANFILPVSIYQ